MPHTTMDWFSLVGCISFVYVIARLTIKIIYRIVCRAIDETEAQNHEENYPDDSDSNETNDSR